MLLCDEDTIANDTLGKKHINLNEIQRTLFLGCTFEWFIEVVSCVRMAFVVEYTVG
tara:strand:+ start:151 stop:318 length:168 start_codon:yes stop_codon:yes gene_type:complete